MDDINYLQLLIHPTGCDQQFSSYVIYFKWFTRLAVNGRIKMRSNRRLSNRYSGLRSRAALRRII